MPLADQRLYAALLRMGRRFREHRLPLLGVAGTNLVCQDLSWPATLRRELEAPPPGVGLAGKTRRLLLFFACQGARLLPRLHQQLGTLLHAEEHTRAALAEWAALADRLGSALRRSSSGAGAGAAAGIAPAFAAAAALEEGLALLSRQAQELSGVLQLELELEAQLAGSGSTGSGGSEPAAMSLDELAALVRQQHPSLFPPVDGASSGHNGGGSSSSSSDSSAGGSDSSAGSSRALAAEQAAALAHVVYRQQRFKFEPFEWVYEGLHPLLLPPRLQRRKLAPLTLAAVAAGVGRRLGLPLLPLPAEPGEAIAAAVAEGPGSSAAGGQGLPLDQMRPDVAQRYAGRTQAAAPTAGPWVLLLGGGGSGAGAGRRARPPAGLQPQQQQSQQEQQQPVLAGQPQVMDACTGQLLDAAQAQSKFPLLPLAADWRARAPLLTWQHMVRTIIQAHQRRGESDLVAHWVYVLLALDPQAAEWGHMLMLQGHDGSAAPPAGG